MTKHANVERAKLSISRCNERIRIIVSDDGVGFDISENGPAAKNEGGFGLFSIRERLEPIGGKVKIQSEPYTGTQVTIEAPLTVESTQGDAI